MTLHGILGKVIGGTQFFHEDGTADSVTAIQAGPCTVIQIKTDETDGYESIQLGFDPICKPGDYKIVYLITKFIGKIFNRFFCIFLHLRIIY